MSKNEESTVYEKELEISYDNNPRNDSDNKMIRVNNPNPTKSPSALEDSEDSPSFFHNDPRNPQGAIRNAALGNKPFNNTADLGDNSEAQDNNDAFDNKNNNPADTGVNGNNNINNNREGNNGPSEKKPGSGLEKKPDDFSGGDKKADNVKRTGSSDQAAAAPHKNPLPGAAPPSKGRPSETGNPAGKKPGDNKKSAGSSIGKKILDKTPIGQKLNSAKQALGMGGGEKGSGGDKQSEFNPAALITKTFANIPTVVKIEIAVGSMLLLLVFAVVLGIGGGVPIGVAAAAKGCDQPSYSVNGSDATEFLCNMTSPFGENGFTVSSTSGWRIHPIYGGNKFHYGTDVCAVGDLTIYAVQSGTVKESGFNGGWGNTVLIDHDGAFTTRYAHLASIDSAMKVGATVTQGQKVGVEGTTGSSTGNHLHFELRDGKGNYLSANPFFGYSDQGYESCVNPNGKPSANCLLQTNPARRIGQEGFAQICGKSVGSFVSTTAKNNSCCGTLTAETTGGDIFDFISTFEGGTGDKYACTTSAGSKGYKAYQNAGDKVTVGPGITTDYIPGMSAGDCISQDKVKSAYTKAESSKRSFIQKTFADVSLSKHQEDAMVSMAYNGCAGFFPDMAKAAEADNLAGLWKAMKDCTNNGLLGLMRRRKAEFALYVTGDYSLAGAYKSKNWNSAQYDLYDSDGIMAKKASGTSSTTCSENSSINGYSTSDIVKLAQQELENWKTLSNDKKRERVATKYMPACGYGAKNTVDQYCAAFISYLLQETGNIERVGAGVGNKCIASNWKNSTGGTFHKVGSSYTPKPGDLAIYSGHIEIVEKVNGNMITNISGNSSPFNVSGGGYPGDTVGNVVRKAAFPLDTKVDGYLTY